MAKFAMPIWTKVNFTVSLTMLLALVPSLAFGYSGWTADTFRYSHVRGFNEPGDISPSSMSALAATGANVLRVPIYMGLSSDGQSYTYDSVRISTVVSLAQQNNFKLVIALTEPAPKGLIWHKNSQGSSLQNSLNSIWSELATRYKGNTTIGAFDLLEEPVANSMAQWVSYSTRLIKTVRAIDPNRVIVWESTPWAAASSYDQSYTYTADPLTNVLPFGNIVYATDIYDLPAICMQGLNSTVQETYPSPATADIGAINKTNLAAAMQLSGLVAFQQKYKVPVYVIGFGCVRWAPPASSNGLPSPDNWSADAIALFESYGWSWNYHAWRQYFGWDAELPASFFYSMTPYANALPNLNWSLYDTKITPNDYDKTHIGFGAYRANTATLSLLKQYFRKNIH